MLNFLAILIKNFENMFKSKFVIGVAILGPVALAALLSFGVIGTGVSNVEASFFSEEKSQLKDVLREGLIQSSFIVHDSETKENCIQEVINGVTNVCVILEEDERGMPLPENLADKNINNFRKSLGVEIFVDFSKQRVVWGIINRVQGVIDGFSEKIQEEVINEISSKFDTSLEKIESLEYGINLVQGELSLSRDAVELASSDLEEFQSESTENLETVRENLQTIISALPVGSAAHQSAIASLVAVNNVLTSINGVTSSSLGLIKNNLDNIYTNLGSARERLSEARSEIISLRDTLSDNGNFNLNKFIEPIPLSYSSISDEVQAEGANNLNLVDYLLPSLISFFIVFSSLMFGSSLVIKERSSNAHIRNYLSKTSGFSFVLGNLIYLILAVLFQAVILLAFAKFSINPSISDNWIPLLIYLFFGIAIFSTLGMILGYLFNTRDTVVLSAVCISLIFIIFSPLINPIETMPSVLRDIFAKSPAVIVEQGVSRILFFDKGIIGSYQPLVTLAAMLIVLFFISIILHKASKERLVKE